MNSCLVVTYHTSFVADTVVQLNADCKTVVNGMTDNVALFPEPLLTQHFLPEV